jgi:hypothetical protein
MHPTAAAARLFAPLKLPVHMPIIEFHQDEVLIHIQLSSDLSTAF